MYLVTYGADYPVKKFSWGLTPSTQEIKLFLQKTPAVLDGNLSYNRLNGYKTGFNPQSARIID